MTFQRKLRSLSPIRLTISPVLIVCFHDSVHQQFSHFESFNTIGAPFCFHFLDLVLWWKFILNLFVLRLAILSIKACKVFHQKPKPNRGLFNSRLKSIHFPKINSTGGKKKNCWPKKKDFFVLAEKLKEISPDNWGRKKRVFREIKKKEGKANKKCGKKILEKKNRENSCVVFVFLVNFSLAKKKIKEKPKGKFSCQNFSVSSHQSSEKNK